MRFLYLIFFTWLVFCGGRFTAPFLKSVARFDDTMVGLSIAMQVLFGGLSAPYGCVIADKVELKYPRRGRIAILLLGIIMTTIVFEMHWVVSILYGNEKCNCQNLEVFFHMILRILFSIFNTMLLSILDGATLSYLKAKNICESEYGKERLYGAVGWAAASIMIGLLLDTRISFHVFFITAPIGAILCVLVAYTYMYDRKSLYHHRVGTSEEDLDEHSDSISQISTESTGDGSLHLRITSSQDLKGGHDTCDEKYNGIEQGTGHHESLTEESNAENSTHKNELTNCKLTLAILKTMFQTYSRIGFLASFIALNVGTSAVENLIFIYFETLGASYTVCGFSVLVTVLFEIPIFYFAPKLLVLFGSEMLQKIACLSHIVRVVGYTLIPKDHALLVLFLEPLHGVTYGCSKTSRVDFAAQMSIEGYEASSQGLLGLVLMTGSISGLAAGGFIEETFGPAVLYRSYAVVVALGLTLFYISEKLDTHIVAPEIEMVKHIPERKT